VGERVAVLGAGGIGFDIAVRTGPGDDAARDIPVFLKTRASTPIIAPAVGSLPPSAHPPGAM
jgi:hypothetical protein